MNRDQLTNVPPNALVKKWRGWAVNAVFDLVRSTGVTGPYGSEDAGGEHGRTPPWSRDRLSWHRVECDTDVPRFSILEVYDGRMDSDGLVLLVREATPEAELYCGNEEYEIIAPTQVGTGSGDPATGWVKLITSYEPVVVRASENVAFLEDLEVDGLKVRPGGGGLLALTSGVESGTGSSDDENRLVAVLSPVGGGREIDAVITTDERGLTCDTGTGTCPDDTGTAPYNGPTAVTRTSHPLGVCVRRIDCDGVESCPELTAIPDRTMRGVHYTDSVVKLRRSCGAWRIVSHGDDFWGAGDDPPMTLEDIQAGSSGQAELWAGGPVVTAYSDTSIAEGTLCDVDWDDRQQRFKITAQRCPPAPA